MHRRLQGDCRNIRCTDGCRRLAARRAEASCRHRPLHWRLDSRGRCCRARLGGVRPGNPPNYRPCCTGVFSCTLRQLYWSPLGAPRLGWLVGSDGSTPTVHAGRQEVGGKPYSSPAYFERTQALAELRYETLCRSRFHRHVGPPSTIQRCSGSGFACQ